VIREGKSKQIDREYLAGKKRTVEASYSIGPSTLIRALWVRFDSRQSRSFVSCKWNTCGPPIGIGYLAIWSANRRSGSLRFVPAAQSSCSWSFASVILDS
jgi:hypothetical protein